jgi:hypothetical protein
MWRGAWRIVDLSRLTHADFAPYLHQKFRLDLGAVEPVELELVEVTAYGAVGTPPGPGRQPFSLFFRGPLSLRVPQHIYRVEHDEMGAIDLFLVPLGPDAEGMKFEAVFT